MITSSLMCYHGAYLAWPSILSKTVLRAIPLTLQMARACFMLSLKSLYAVEHVGRWFLACRISCNACLQICVWSTGNAARPIVQSISSQIPEQKATMEGRNPASTKLSVDPFLRIEGAMDAIALGDCSRMAGRPLPASAQVCPCNLPLT